MSKIPLRAAAVAAAVTLTVLSAGSPALAREHRHRVARCQGPIACIAAPGAQLKVDRVQLWGNTGSAANGQALIAVWVDVLDTTGPSGPNAYPSTDPLYQHRGILDPNPNPLSGSYYVVDATHNVNAEYSNGCQYHSTDANTGNISYLVSDYGPTDNKLLYPHQSEHFKALCFAVADSTRPSAFTWYPNAQHARGFTVWIPGARPYSGAPVPVN